MENKNANNQEWFSIHAKAGAKDAAVVSVFDVIGNYGITAQDFRNQLAEFKDAKRIDLLIDTEGGDVFQGWSMVNALIEHPATVTARVVGLAASMGSVLMLAADEVQVYENSFVMIHNPWTVTGGDAKDHETATQNLRMIQDKIVRAYVKKTGRSSEEISAMMEVETLMDGETAKDLGFADTLLREFKAAALADKWKDTPRHELPIGLVGKVETPIQPEPAFTPEPKLETKIKPLAMSEPTTPTPPAPAKVSIKDLLAEDKPRREEIQAISAKFNISPDQMNHAIENGTEVQEFRNSVMDSFEPGKLDPVAIENSKNVGDKDASNYSVLKAIRETSNGGKMSGLEAEVQAELAQRYLAATGNPSSGVLVPGEWLAAKTPGIQNTATVGTGTSGGNTVATEMQGLTGYLKDYSILPKVGASIFRDSEGNLAFPRATAGYSGTWDDEDDEIANSDATLAANLTLTPKRVGAGTSITKQLAAQNSVDYETFMRNELLYGVGTAVDRGAITGTGTADQPTGLLATSGLGSYTWAVGTSLRGNVIAQWKVLRDAKCPMQSVNWLFDAGVRANWSTTPQVAGAGAFMFEQQGNSTDGNVYGFPAYDHTDVTANKVILGDFSSLMVAMWGGMELIIDPFSEKKKGIIEMYVQTFADVGVRQPGCFVIGDDGTVHAGAIS